MHPLKRRIKELGKTQTEVERALGLPERAIHKMTIGERQKTSYKEMQALCRLLDATPRELGLEQTGFRESEVAYIPAPDRQELQMLLANLMYKKGQAETMVVNSPSLQLIGLMPGDHILVDGKAKPNDGDPVVLEVTDGDEGTAETVLRLFEAPFLVPAAVSRRFEIYTTDDPRVTIKGVIVASYRTPIAA